MDLDVVDEVHVHAGEEDEGDALEDETDEEDLIMIKKVWICEFRAEADRAGVGQQTLEPRSAFPPADIPPPAAYKEGNITYSVNNNDPSTTVNIDIPERRKSTHPT